MVDEEWYDTALSLREIPDSDWKDWRVPGRLRDKLKAKLEHQCQRPMLSGLVLRVGKVAYGSCQEISHLLSHGKSTFLIGEPGTGKTTALRELTRLMSNSYKKLVVVVDTTCELGGFGTLPHEAIGNVMRIKVQKREDLHREMVRAIQNYSPHVIVIDEIGSAEVEAARSTRILTVVAGIVFWTFTDA